jgi:hypothetical protein
MGVTTDGRGTDLADGGRSSLFLGDFRAGGRLSGTGGVELKAMRELLQLV